eukprot:16437586-Heterocapsa_arctica.AAC.1
MDVPKHYTGAAVLAVCRAMQMDAEHGFKARAQRSTKLVAKDVKVTIPNFAKCRAFDHAELALSLATEGRALGAVWCPSNHVVLGRDAGRR